MKRKMNLTEATIEALQDRLYEDEEKDTGIKYLEIEFYGEIPVDTFGIEGLVAQNTLKDKVELEEYVSKIYPKEVVNAILNFDNNEATDIQEPLNATTCNRSCEFTLPDYSNISVRGYYRKSKIDTQSQLSQEEAVKQVKDELEIIHKEIDTGEFIEIVGEIGGDVKTYRIYKDGKVYNK